MTDFYLKHPVDVLKQFLEIDEATEKALREYCNERVEVIEKLYLYGNSETSNPIGLFKEE